MEFAIKGFPYVKPIAGKGFPEIFEAFRELEQKQMIPR
jgi:hypothetical protein